MNDFFNKITLISIFLLVFVIVITILIKNKKNIIENKPNCTQYLPKKVMTITEFEVYRQILDIIPKNYHLLAQVRLCDIVKINTKAYKPKTSKWQSLFNKISRWHCDFVVINEQGKTIICAELDDHTHRNEKRINRDIEFNKIFKETEITLFRGDKSQLIELIKAHWTR
ncbi:DUF2726 domain-containing protein [Providencia sp. wls1919]|nr:DUF2726 domain-containing protein [Providencia sp. wls1919]